MCSCVFGVMQELLWEEGLLFYKKPTLLCCFLNNCSWQMDGCVQPLGNYVNPDMKKWKAFCFFILLSWICLIFRRTETEDCISKSSHKKSQNNTLRWSYKVSHLRPSVNVGGRGCSLTLRKVKKYCLTLFPFSENIGTKTG